MYLGTKSGTKSEPLLATARWSITLDGLLPAAHDRCDSVAVGQAGRGLA
jgi:hypothetical protein